MKYKIEKNVHRRRINCVKKRNFKTIKIGITAFSLTISTLLFQNYKTYYTKVKKTQETYEEPIQLYEDVTKDIGSLFKKLKLAHPVACYSVFQSLLKRLDLLGSGSTNKQVDIYENEGIDILLGQGSCRNASEMLQRCLDQAGYESYLVLNYYPVEDSKETKGNHLVVLVPYQSEIYILDPINDTYYLLNSANSAVNPVSKKQIEFRLLERESRRWIEDIELLKLYAHILTAKNSLSETDMKQYQEEGIYRKLLMDPTFEKHVKIIKEQNKKMVKLMM